MVMVIVMMKRRKDEEKVEGILFPRLHVNDTIRKEEPKPPPRNKMALYEQLRIRSERSSSKSASSFPLLRNNGDGSRPSASATHGYGQLHNTISLSSTTANLERKPINNHENMDKEEPILSIGRESTFTKQENESSLVYDSSRLCDTKAQAETDGCLRRQKLLKGPKNDLDSVFGLSSDAVAGLIGQKRFWKARKILVYQQRLFSRQLFELHRLVKVQRLIVESSPLLLEDDLHLRKHQTELSRTKTPSSCSILEKSPDVVVKKIFSPWNGDTCIDSIKEYSKDPAKLALRTSPDPPIKQWLIPIISPSEGLVYKPYTGLSPPPGHCGAMGLTPRGCTKTFSSAQMFFPPFGVNARMVGPYVEKSSPSTGAHMQAQQSSSNMSRHSEIQGISTASSPSERAHIDTLPLFPIEPKAVEVVKVVPHNPRSATESAARIVKSIQEERNLLV